MLHKDEVRDKIVDGTLKRENVDNSDLIEVLNFLMSKKQNHKCTKEFNGLIEVDWRKVVKQCKRKSVSSVFSKRKHVVYKIVAQNERFMNVLILFYNLVIQKGIVLERWRNVLDVMLEKGKGPILGKMRIIELIEGDLQIIVRACVGLRNDDNIKNDERLSKFNFGSRKQCSIESALLEKKVLHDTSK